MPDIAPEIQDLLRTVRTLTKLVELELRVHEVVLSYKEAERAADELPRMPRLLTLSLTLPSATEAGGAVPRGNFPYTVPELLDPQETPSRPSMLGCSLSHVAQRTRLRLVYGRTSAEDSKRPVHHVAGLSGLRELTLDEGRGLSASTASSPLCAVADVLLQLVQLTKLRVFGWNSMKYLRHSRSALQPLDAGAGEGCLTGLTRLEWIARGTARAGRYQQQVLSACSKLLRLATLQVEQLWVEPYAEFARVVPQLPHLRVACSCCQVPDHAEFWVVPCTVGKDVPDTYVHSRSFHWQWRCAGAWARRCGL